MPLMINGVPLHGGKAYKENIGRSAANVLPQRYRDAWLRAWDKAHNESWQQLQLDFMGCSHERYRAIPCGCGWPKCKDWHVWPVAAVQCVKFTKEQAMAVAALLNKMEVGQCQNHHRPVTVGRAVTRSTRAGKTASGKTRPVAKKVARTRSR